MTTVTFLFNTADTLSVQHESSTKLPCHALALFSKWAQFDFQQLPAHASLSEALLFSFGYDTAIQFPYAAVLAEAGGVMASTGDWLCIEPMHVQVDKDAAYAMGQAVLAIQTVEAEAIYTDLKKLLADDGVALHSPNSTFPGEPVRWFLQSESKIVLAVEPAENILSKSISQFLPSASDSPSWCRLLTEIQMVLNAHSVNKARAARGDYLINGVWLWGAGARREAVLKGSNPVTHAFGNHPLLRALAKKQRIPHGAFPASFAQFKNYLSEWGKHANVVLVCDEKSMAQEGGWTSILSLVRAKMIDVLNVRLNPETAYTLTPQGVSWWRRLFHVKKNNSAERL